MAQIGIAGTLAETYGGSAYFDAFALGPNARNLKTGWKFEDFLTGSAQYRGWLYSYYNGVGSSSTTDNGTALRPGWVYHGTGTTAAGYAYTRGDTGGFLFGGGTYVFETDVYLGALSTAIEEFDLYAGFGSVLNGDQTNGVYFRYNRAVLGTNWHCCSADNGARTATDSGIAVAAAAWTRLKIMVNAAGTEARYYIAGALVGTVIANIPIVAGRTVGPLATIVKTVGVTNRGFWLDWVWLQYDLTTGR